MSNSAASVMSTKTETIMKLIEAYREMPYLYNKLHDNYYNKSLRNEGYKTLLQIYRNFDKYAMLKTLKKKVDNLKSTYYRELKKVEASRLTAQRTEDVYVPTLWYFESLHFLGSLAEPCRQPVNTRYYNQYKSRMKAKARQLKQPMSGTSEGPATTINMTLLEKRLRGILGSCSSPLPNTTDHQLPEYSHQEIGQVDIKTEVDTTELSDKEPILKPNEETKTKTPHKRRHVTPSSRVNEFEDPIKRRARMEASRLQVDRAMVTATNRQAAAIETLAAQVGRFVDVVAQHYPYPLIKQETEWEQQQ